MMGAAAELAPVTGVAEASRILNIPRSTLYRLWNPPNGKPAVNGQRPKPGRALSDQEKEDIRTVLNSERFQDQSPREVYAALLDEDIYLSHWRTMYRILDEHDEVRERRNQLRHPVYAKPELLATGPNQLWSWDITKLRGPATWTYFYLYVMLDVFSRYVVGWLLAPTRISGVGRGSDDSRLRQTADREGTVDPPCGPRRPHDRQIDDHVDGRPGRYQESQPTSRLGRQPLFGGSVSHLEVPTRLSGPLRFVGRCPSMEPQLLHLVQPGASSHCLEPAHTGRCPLWPGG